jgi:hypothetical protein
MNRFEPENTMTTMRIVLAALFGALALGAVACGSSDVGAGTASSAGLLRPGAIAYWQTVSDPDSPQWDQAEELLQRFPDGDKWIAKLKNDLLREEKVSWEQDVRPALGDVVDLAVYAQTSRKPAVVGLTNPKDPDKLVALVRKLDVAEGGDPTVTRVVGDWVAISDTQAAIDTALKDGGGRSLDDEQSFKSAMNDLPEDALSRGYIDPARVIDLLGPEERKALSMVGLESLDFAGAWAKAKDDGAELALALRGEGADRLFGATEPYSSRFLGKVPDDAFAFLSFQGRGLRRQLEQLRSNPLFAMELRDFERESGVDVDEVIGLLQGEVAFYARPAAPIPELTLVLQADDEAQAKATVERLLRGVSDQLEGVHLSVESLDGAVVVSTSTRAVEELGGSGDKLPDSDRYKQALSAASAPDEYTGLAYVDLAEAWALVREYLGLSGEEDEVPPAVRRNLEPLQSLVAFGKQDGSLSTSVTFLEIK